MMIQSLTQSMDQFAECLFVAGQFANSFSVSVYCQIAERQSSYLLTLVLKASLVYVCQFADSESD